MKLRTAMTTLLMVAAATTAMAQAAAKPPAAPKVPVAAKAPAAPKAPAQTASKAKLKTPAALNEKAPDVYKVNLDTSAGPIVIEVHRDWAPLGADRFYNLVKNGYYDDIRFFRVLEGFMAQFGMSGDPAIQAIWGTSTFKDDPVVESNKRGYVTFAKSAAPNSRSTQLFINFADNEGLDKQGFAPIGKVVSGMEAVDKLYAGYGRTNVPDQGRIAAQGNKYLMAEYPKLDYIKKATIEP